MILFEIYKKKFIYTKILKKLNNFKKIDSFRKTVCICTKSTFVCIVFMCEISNSVLEFQKIMILHCRFSTYFTSLTEKKIDQIS